MPLWTLYVPGVVIVAAGVVAFRWLLVIQRRMQELAERVARLEGGADRRPPA